MLSTCATGLPRKFACTSPSSASASIEKARRGRWQVAHETPLPAGAVPARSAGFESGHAYGKAMRTVKSCVGTTWCRFGVPASTGLAIRIEERYRGIRAPHKLKAAVSGCIRECAEAQRKDFGVIATERGWNLSACGNGGAKPRHAELLAADLDEETSPRPGASARAETRSTSRCPRCYLSYGHDGASRDAEPALRA